MGDSTQWEEVHIAWPKPLARPNNQRNKPERLGPWLGRQTAGEATWVQFPKLAPKGRPGVKG